MNKLSGTLLAVLFILFLTLTAVDSWAGCSSTKIGGYAIGFSDGYSSDRNCQNATGQNGCSAAVYTSCAERFGPSPSVQGYFAGYTEEQICGYNTSCHIDYGCKWGIACYVKSANCYVTVCSTQCEADSLVCLQNGGAWTNTGAFTCNGKSCKMSNCLQSDTLWLNDSKAACDAIGGENNYAITDIDETCVHSGICCPRDSALVGNTCKWRCDSLYTACTAKNGYWYAGVLQDTTISGADSTFTNKCYYNCSYAYNKDSTTSVTDGNTACSSPSTPIADCTRMPNDFSSVRTTYGDSVYSYDFLTPGSAAYIDSIVLTPCSRFMYRCTVNGKYKYWYSDADIPTGCTNIVKIK